MKTKRVITGIISATLCLSLLTACSGQTDSQSSADKQESKSSTTSGQSTESQQSSADESSKQTVAPGKDILTINDPG